MKGTRAPISEEERAEAEEHASARFGSPHAFACSIGEALRGLERGDHARVREALLVVAAAAALLPDVQAAMHAIEGDGL